MHHELFKWWPRARLEVHFIVHRHVLAALLGIIQVVHCADIATVSPEEIAVAHQDLVVVLLVHFSYRHFSNSDPFDFKLL